MPTIFTDSKKKSAETLPQTPHSLTKQSLPTTTQMFIEFERETQMKPMKINQFEEQKTEYKMVKEFKQVSIKEKTVDAVQSNVSPLSSQSSTKQSPVTTTQIPIASERQTQMKPTKINQLEQQKSNHKIVKESEQVLVKEKTADAVQSDVSTLSSQSQNLPTTTQMFIESERQTQMKPIKINKFEQQKTNDEIVKEFEQVLIKDETVDIVKSDVSPLSSQSLTKQSLPRTTQIPIASERQSQVKPTKTYQLEQQKTVDKIDQKGEQVSKPQEIVDAVQTNVSPLSSLPLTEQNLATSTHMFIESERQTQMKPTKISLFEQEQPEDNIVTEPEQVSVKEETADAVKSDISPLTSQSSTKQGPLITTKIPIASERQTQMKSTKISQFEQQQPENKIVKEFEQVSVKEETVDVSSDVSPLGAKTLAKQSLCRTSQIPIASERQTQVKPTKINQPEQQKTVDKVDQKYEPVSTPEKIVDAVLPLSSSSLTEQTLATSTHLFIESERQTQMKPININQFERQKTEDTIFKDFEQVTVKEEPVDAVKSDVSPLSSQSSKIPIASERQTQMKSTKTNQLEQQKTEDKIVKEFEQVSKIEETFDAVETNVSSLSLLSLTEPTLATSTHLFIESERKTQIQPIKINQFEEQKIDDQIVKEFEQVSEKEKTLDSVQSDVSPLSSLSLTQQSLPTTTPVSVELEKLTQISQIEQHKRDDKIRKECEPVSKSTETFDAAEPNIASVSSLTQPTLTTSTYKFIESERQTQMKPIKINQFEQEKVDNKIVEEFEQISKKEEILNAVQSDVSPLGSQSLTQESLPVSLESEKQTQIEAKKINQIEQHKTDDKIMKEFEPVSKTEETFDAVESNVSSFSSQSSTEPTLATSTHKFIESERQTQMKPMKTILFDQQKMDDQIVKEFEPVSKTEESLDTLQSDVSPLNSQSLTQQSLPVSHESAKQTQIEATKVNQIEQHKTDDKIVKEFEPVSKTEETFDAVESNVSSFSSQSSTEPTLATSTHKFIESERQTQMKPIKINQSEEQKTDDKIITDFKQVPVQKETVDTVKSNVSPLSSKSLTQLSLPTTASTSLESEEQTQIEATKIYQIEQHKKDNTILKEFEPVSKTEETIDAVESNVSSFSSLTEPNLTTSTHLFIESERQTQMKPIKIVQFEQQKIDDQIVKGFEQVAEKEKTLGDAQSDISTLGAKSLTQQGLPTTTQLFLESEKQTQLKPTKIIKFEQKETDDKVDEKYEQVLKNEESLDSVQSIVRKETLKPIKIIQFEQQKIDDQIVKEFEQIPEKGETLGDVQSDVSTLSSTSLTQQGLPTTTQLFLESEKQTQMKPTKIIQFEQKETDVNVDQKVSKKDSAQSIVTTEPLKTEPQTELASINNRDDNESEQKQITPTKNLKLKYIRQSSDTRNDVLEDEVLLTSTTDAQNKDEKLIEPQIQLQSSQDQSDPGKEKQLKSENKEPPNDAIIKESSSTISSDQQTFGAASDLTQKSIIHQSFTSPEIKSKSLTDESRSKSSETKSPDSFYSQADVDVSTSFKEVSTRTSSQDNEKSYKAEIKNLTNPTIDHSGSSESIYSSLESRPLSSDADNLHPKGFSSEYQTAVDKSCLFESTEYESAVSLFDSFSSKTISSNDSIKSFPSQSETSAELGTIDASDTSETIVASLIEDDIDDLEELGDETVQEIDDNDPIDVSQNLVQITMKRSKEMIFKDNGKAIEEPDVKTSSNFESFQSTLTTQIAKDQPSLGSDNAKKSTIEKQQYATLVLESDARDLTDTFDDDLNEYRNMESFDDDSQNFMQTLEQNKTKCLQNVPIREVKIVEETKEYEVKSHVDCYESEYASQFGRGAKKKKHTTEIDYTFDSEKKSFTPSQLVSEVIVEDITTEELEAEKLKSLPRTAVKTHTSIPNITVTDDCQEEPVEESETNQGLENAEVKPLKNVDESVQNVTKPTSANNEEVLEKLIQEQYKQKLEEIKALDIELDSSKILDSFEVLDKPDLLDDFVMVEEVGKEANETNSGGQSMNINPATIEKQFDTEVEKILVNSAPADPKLGSLLYKDDFNLEFEESPPQDAQTYGETNSSKGGTELPTSNKRWIEMQLQDSKYPYPYDISSGVLEDIKEEDSEVDVTSSRISSFKESFSSTPEYSRRCINRCEQDNVSLSSLQEFESLEKAISLENRNKTIQGSTGSSNGSFTRRYKLSQKSEDNGKGDDTSNSSLKDFEGLETACLEAHLIEIKAKQEASLLSHSDESNKSYDSEGKVKDKSSNALSETFQVNVSDDTEQTQKNEDIDNLKK